MSLYGNYLNFKKNRTSKLVHSGSGFSTRPISQPSRNLRLSQNIP
jgi:hypothetical protein